MKLATAALDWLDDRIGFRNLLAGLLSGASPERHAWLRTTGAACLALVLVEIFTGSILSLFYSAGPTTAYASVTKIEGDPLGKLVRGMHHWASAGLIILGGATILRMLIHRDYTGRRDLVWLGSLTASQLFVLFQLTGHALPWDTNAFASARVEAGIAGNVWVAGPALKRVILAGNDVSSSTLALWYGTHIVVLPAVLLALGFAMALALSRRQSTPTKGSITPVPYYPHQLSKEMIVALAVVAGVFALALLSKTPLELQATPENLDGYVARSEWYVMPLHALTLIPPFNSANLEPIATFIVPGLLIGALALLPFVDRTPNPSKRLQGLIKATVALTVLATLALTAYGFQVDNADAAKRAEEKRKASQFDQALADQGKAFYEKNACFACHKISGKGNAGGPDLTHAARLHPDRAWQIDHLKDPAKLVPGSTMPKYGHLPEADLMALAEYMFSLK